jgi:hypothetical protein
MNKLINQSRQQYLPDTFSAFSKMIFNFSTWRPATAHVIIAWKTSTTRFLMPSNIAVDADRHFQRHEQDAGYQATLPSADVEKVLFFTTR